MLMLTVNPQNRLTQFVFALLPITALSSLHYEHGYAPAHEYKDQDYSFSYGVKDLHTGDVKQQWEKKEGGVVKGSYSMIEADGRLRIVDYTADKHSGFTAVVKHKGVAKHPEDKHVHSFIPEKQYEKPVSHNDFSIKPSAEAHYGHSDIGEEQQSTLSNHNQGVKYEIKYLYPSEIKQYEESLAAQQSAVPVREDEEDSYESSETNQKQVHYYVPQSYEDQDTKSGESQIKNSYYYPSSTTTEIPVDFTYLKQGLRLLNSQRDHSAKDESQNNNILLKDVYAAIKEKYNFSPSLPEHGFKPIEKNEDRNNNKVVNIKPRESVGLGQYSSPNIGEVAARYTPAPIAKDQKFYYLPSYYAGVKNSQQTNNKRDISQIKYKSSFNPTRTNLKFRQK